MSRYIVKQACKLPKYVLKESTPLPSGGEGGGGQNSILNEAFETIRTRVLTCQNGQLRPLFS